MPTVMRFEGLRMVVYPGDHRTSHVHVIGRGREAISLLNGPAGPVRLRENYGFSRAEIARIRREPEAGMAMLCDAWENINGKP